MSAPATAPSTAAAAAAGTPAAARTRGSSFLLPACTLWQREIVRFLRQRNRVLGALGQPLVFWLLLGSGFGNSFRAPGAPEGEGYLEYFYPGVLVMILLFTSIFATISIIEDRREGFLQAVLVAPVHRAAIVLGKVLGGATLAVGQALLFLALAPTIGIRLAPLQVLALAGTLSLVAVGLTGLGFALAWRSDSVQGFHAVMNVVLIPMWLLSGATFPAAGGPIWLRAVMLANPLTYGTAAVRRLVAPEAAAAAHLPSLALSLAVSSAFALGVLGLGLALVRSRSAGSAV